MKITFFYKFVFASSILMLVSLFPKAQQNKSISISDFQGVSVSSGIDLYLTQSNVESIKITASADLIDKIVVVKEGNLLNIHYKENNNWNWSTKRRSPKVYVSYKTLQSISASGGSDVFTQNGIKTDKLMLRASGGSDLSVSVTAKNLEVETSGGSDIELNGSATNMIVRASGGSDVNALGLIVEYAKVRASGGADINIYVSKGLEADASGGSDINYKGNAAVKKISSSKSGDVKKLE